MNIKDKYTKWNFPLNIDDVDYLNRYLDRCIGSNEIHNNKERMDFVQSIYNSLSLNIYEKKLVLDSYNNLTSYQLNQLIDVFENEVNSFFELEKDYPHDMKKLRLKNIVEWIFVLDKIHDINEKSIVLIDLINQDVKNDWLINNALHLMKYNSDDEEFIFIFDIIKCKCDIDELYWNYYIYSLSQKNRFNDIIHLNGKESNKFIFSCKISYLIKQVYFCDYVLNNYSEIIKYIREEKDAMFNIQFRADVNLFYLWKNESVDKYTNRQITYFVDSQVFHDSYDFEKNFLYKRLSYIVTPLLLSDDGNLRVKFCEYIYNHLSNHIKKYSNDISGIKSDLFFKSQGNYIEQCVSLLSLFKEGASLLFRLVNENGFIDLHPSYYSLVNILHINDIENDDFYLSASIDRIIKNGDINKAEFISIYISLYTHGKKVACDLLLQKYKINNETYDLEKVTTLLCSWHDKHRISESQKSRIYSFLDGNHIDNTVN
ncbi:hypothetical protein BOO24_18185 [Vibrio navarrensis]|uniref:hypothetical protein n=2 Tax=Vibrio navarrensis TaxID=29495 RepID=UPI00186A6873|nr:hypothetical protein [Vibrio navarrensis]MBE4594269.1 hypothetical protein [Vibrio navarrensis]